MRTLKKSTRGSKVATKRDRPFELVRVVRGGVYPWGRVPDKKHVEKFKTLEQAQKRVQELNAWADVLDLSDSFLDHIVVKKNGRKVYEQGRTDRC